MKIALFAVIVSLLALSVRGDELLPSSTPPWRCYTGIAADGHSNEFTTVAYGLRGDFLRQHMPEPAKDSFQWVPLTNETRATVEHIAIVHGKQIWRAIYHPTKPEIPESRPEAAVFLLSTAEGLLRPFLVLFPDDTETFESYCQSSADVPFSLTAQTNMSGTGAFYSTYSFTFPKGVPRFLGRTDGGRHNEPKTFK